MNITVNPHDLAQAAVYVTRGFFAEYTPPESLLEDIGGEGELVYWLCEQAEDIEKLRLMSTAANGVPRTEWLVEGCEHYGKLVGQAATVANDLPKDTETMRIAHTVVNARCAARPGVAETLIRIEVVPTYVDDDYDDGPTSLPLANGISVFVGERGLTSHVGTFDNLQDLVHKLVDLEAVLNAPIYLPADGEGD